MSDYEAHFPHCDNLVIHEPKKCEFCDMYPKLQQYRIDNNINFTGENNPNKKQCPAEARRDLNIINKWYGNTPKPNKELAKIDDFDYDKYNGIKKEK